MKITYILPISWGGIPHYTAELANAVSRYADIAVLKPKDSNDELFSENVEVINAFKSIQFSRKNKIKVFSISNLVNFFSFKNIKLVDDIKPDVIHFPELYPQSSIFTFLYRIYRKYPTICTLHATFKSPLDLLSLNARDLTHGILASFTEFTKWLIEPKRIIVHTQQNKNTLIRKGLERNKIVVIPHGAFTLFRKYHRNERTDNENCILFFGHIQKNKGVEYLIRATPIVAQEIPDIKVIIAGEGDLSKCLNLIVDNSRFEIYNEFIPNEKVPELFQRAKVVVLPYIHHQGHSGVLNVARAFGKPVVVTNVGSLPEMIENGMDGLVVPSKNPRALAEAIVKLLKDDKLRKKMARNALKKAQELSWDNIAKIHMKIYEGVLNEREKRNKD